MSDITLTKALGYKKVQMFCAHKTVVNHHIRPEESILMDLGITELCIIESGKT